MNTSPSKKKKTVLALKQPFLKSGDAAVKTHKNSELLDPTNLVKHTDRKKQYVSSNQVHGEVLVLKKQMYQVHLPISPEPSIKSLFNSLEVTLIKDNLLIAAPTHARN